ncbi:MAG: acyl-CoA desaturase [Edaphocola sp.]
MNSTHTVPKFPAVKNSLHNELKSRVQRYFEENNIKQTGNMALWHKAVVLLVAFIGIYLHLLVFQPAWYFAITECALLGCVVASIGFNVMHDGGHGSFSQSKVMNKIASWSSSMLGASQFMWNMKHNMIHHTYTNVDGVDDDIEIGALMRMAPTQKHYKFHRFQHVYFVLLYMWMYVFWVYYSDYNKYFSGKIGEFPLKKMSLSDHVRFWAVKVWHLAVFVVIPIAVVGWLHWLVGFMTLSLVGGFILSIVFQLAHTVEDAHFPMADADSNKLPDEFAAHQIKTTANFGTKDKVLNWFVGGLNFQIEHHLFPKISHVHYPAISKIVKSVCQEYQLQYIEYPSMGSAVAAHVRFLKEMGKA